MKQGADKQLKKLLLTHRSLGWEEGKILVCKTWSIVVNYFNWVELKALAREELNTAPVAVVVRTWPRAAGLAVTARQQRCPVQKRNVWRFGAFGMLFGLFGVSGLCVEKKEEAEDGEEGRGRGWNCRWRGGRGLWGSQVSSRTEILWRNILWQVLANSNRKMFRNWLQIKDQRCEIMLRLRGAQPRHWTSRELWLRELGPSCVHTYQQIPLQSLTFPFLSRKSPWNAEACDYNNNKNLDFYKPLEDFWFNLDIWVKVQAVISLYPLCC